MTVIFVGQNPSAKNDDSKIPFRGTESGKRLVLWSELLSIKHYDIVNVSDSPGRVYLTEVTMDDFASRLIGKMAELDLARAPYKVVALGKVAHEALKLVNISHFTLPRPSGRNRALNDKVLLNNLLNQCYNYIHGE